MDKSIINVEDVQIDQVIAHLPEKIICKSAVVVKKNLLILEVGREDGEGLIRSNFADIVVFNLSTGKLIKAWRGISTFTTFNSKHLSPGIIGLLEGYLIGCAQYCITVYATERAFKVCNKLHSADTPNLPMSANIQSFPPPFSIVRILNSQELLILQKNILLKWNFLEQNGSGQLSTVLKAEHDICIRDFHCNQKKNMLLMLEQRYGSGSSFRIAVFDLVNLVLLSSYDFNSRKRDIQWRADIEHGWMSLIDYDYQMRLCSISTLTLDSASKLVEDSTFTIKRFALSVFHSSNELSYLDITLHSDKLVWGFFDYKENLASHGTFVIVQDRRGSYFLIDYLDKTGLFLGGDHGKIFLTRKNNILKYGEVYTLEKFLEFANDLFDETDSETEPDAY